MAHSAAWEIQILMDTRSQLIYFGIQTFKEKECSFWGVKIHSHLLLPLVIIQVCLYLRNRISVLLSIWAAWALVCTEFFFRFFLRPGPDHRLRLRRILPRIYNAFYTENRRKRKVIFIGNCATTNEKVLCGKRNFRSPTHLSLPRIELSKNETEKIKYLRFIVKNIYCWISFWPLLNIHFTRNSGSKLKEVSKKVLLRSFDFQSSRNLWSEVMFGPFPMNATALVNHIKPPWFCRKTGSKKPPIIIIIIMSDMNKYFGWRALKIQ